jgi:NAD(P)-dependent dehydrogenase (short-subunit alcohol dehydrogenase family)
VKRFIGYARVSTVHQNLDRQLGALRAARCKTIFAEKASGKDTKGRPELERAIDQLGAGDVLVLAEWDRATRSMMDGVTILRNGGGRIINFASNAGRSSSPVLGCSYTAAKTGVIGITRHLAKEYASRGIVVNTVAPGPLDGDRVADQLRDPKDRQTLTASIPVGRLGRESEICDVVMFLAMHAPTYMTGAILDVNGGLVLAT